MPNLQSAHRKNQSTERALMRVTSDIRLVNDHGQVARLVLLHLGAAFDTANHDLLLHCLFTIIGINGAAHGWFVLP